MKNFLTHSKRIFKYSILSSFLILSFSFSANAEDASGYKPNAKSVEYNEKGVAISNSDPKMAEQFFQKALSLDNKNISALLNFATLKITQGQQASVVGILEEYAKKYPKISDIHMLLGDVYFANKNIDKALDSYKKVLLLKQDTPNLYSKMGNIYMLQKKLLNAEFMYEQAVKANPSDYSTLLNYANILLATKKPDKALEVTKKALNIKETKEGLLTLATIYETRNDTTMALEYYKKAKAKNPDDKEILSKIDELENSMESF